MLGPYELNTIVTGDARELSKAIPDESVDLIFTDPVYDRIDDYEWLAETAARVLKPDRACLVWCGIGYLPQTLNALGEKNICFKWQLVALRPPGIKSQYCMNKVFSNWRSLLWFQKGDSSPLSTISDTMVSQSRGANINLGRWQKDFWTTYKLVGKFIESGIVFDPFTGGGTAPAVCKMLNRDYLAFEIDPEPADLARQRVANTQPPLPLVMPEQLELNL